MAGRVSGFCLGPGGCAWRIQQMLIDPHEHNDWVAEFEADLAASKEAGYPVLRLVRLGGLV